MQLIAIERCWSTLELKGAGLLSIVGAMYGLLACMVLDAHVSWGYLASVFARKPLEYRCLLQRIMPQMPLAGAMVQAKKSAIPFDGCVC